jgi:hypothetical protein
VMLMVTDPPLAATFARRAIERKRTAQSQRANARIASTSRSRARHRGREGEAKSGTGDARPRQVSPLTPSSPSNVLPQPDARTRSCSQHGRRARARQRGGR